MKKRVKLLHEFELLEQLSAETLAQIEAHSQIRTLERGTFAYLPGDRAESIYFLDSGRIKISRLSSSGKELTLNMVEPGLSFGELSILSDDARETMAESLERSTVRVVSRAAMLRVLENEPPLLLKLTRMLSLRQKRLEKRLTDVVYKNAPARLANLLLELSEDYGVRDSRGILLRIKLSQSALGNLLGVSREIVNHTFSGLRRRGVIQLIEGRVIIRHPEALQELAA